MRLKNRQGQATTEYILLAAFLVTILMAISGLMNRFVSEAGEEIETRASEVMAQRTLGIPLSWFLGGSSGQIPGAEDADGADQGAGAGGGAGPGAGANGPGFGDSGNSSRDEDTQNDSNNNTNVAAGVAADGDAGGRGGRGSRRRGSGGVIEVEGEDAAEEAPQEEQANQVEAEESEEKKNQENIQAANRREYALSDEERKQGGSCEDFDFFRLIKILAIVGLVVLGGAYLSSASGNRGGHKK